METINSWSLENNSQQEENSTYNKLAANAISHNWVNSLVDNVIDLQPEHRRGHREKNV